MMTFRIALLITGVLALVGCNAPEPAVQTVAPTSKASPDRIARLWSNSCALCHVSGVAGAPRAGNMDEWEPRLTKGKPMLLKHTIEGFNSMPPLGYCMSCSEQDFSELIDLMTGGAAK